MLAPAFYRWWARARRPLAEQWEERLEERKEAPFFAASKGCTAVDLVYKRAVRAEAAAADGNAARQARAEGAGSYACPSGVFGNVPRGAVPYHRSVHRIPRQMHLCHDLG